ncbi:MAG: adenosine deaminase [Alphaproteobacteria bacterium]|jgi:adenosine deaminase|nr:adenosine deaminase [Alphaproteobacteria bacterium]
MKNFIQNLNKAEIHLHIEGTLEPKMLLSLAKSNQVKIPYSSIEEVQNAYKFSNLQSFLNLYYQGLAVLQTEEDFYNLMYSYLQKAHLQNVKVAEIFFDPQAHTSRLIAWQTFMNGFKKAMIDAKANLGINSHLIMCFLRHLPEKDALKTLEESLDYRNDIIGVGLDSSELGNPPELFKTVFKQAKDYNFKLVAHAGEEADHTYIWQAIDILGVDRVDHGNWAIKDKELMQRLAKDKIPLTMCPLSNEYLKTFKVQKDSYPLQTFLDYGIIATINSDDPAYFGGYINENFEFIQKQLNLKEDTLKLLANNSLQAVLR